MSRIAYPDTWTVNDRSELDQLFERARKECKWFVSQGLCAGGYWFSPDELQAEQEKGQFVWGAVNWRLHDPNEKLKEIDREIARLSKEREAVLRRMQR